MCLPAFADEPPSGASAPEKAGNNAGLSDVFSILEENRRVISSIGSAAATSLSESPSSVWVIDRQTIRARATVVWTDLLRMIPGVMVQDASTGDPLLHFRSAGDTYRPFVLLLVDGRMANELVSYRAAPNNLPIEIDDIERIEVVIGPASTLYGANAYMGVINIVTRSTPKEGYLLSAETYGGAGWAQTGGRATDLGGVGPLVKGSVSYAQRFGNFGLRFSVGGDQLPAPTETGVTPFLISPPTPTKHLHGVARLTYDRENWRLWLEMGVGRTLQNVFEEITLYDHRIDWHGHFQANGKDVLASGDELQVAAWGRYSRLQSIAYLPLFESLVTGNGAWAGEVNAKYTTPLFYYNRLSLGVQARLLTLQMIELGPLTLDPRVVPQQYYGVFVEDVFRPIRQLSLVLGGRLETRETPAWRAFSRLTANPRASLIYMPTSNHALRLEYSTAFRNPTITELGFTSTLLNGTVTTFVGNLDLRPEQHQLFAFGYNGQLGWLSPRLEAFYGLRRDEFIRTTLDPNSDFNGIYRNGGRSSYAGGSAYLKALPTQGVELEAQYTLTRTLTANGTNWTPEHVAAVGCILRFGRWTGSLSVAYQSTTRTITTLAPQPFVGAHRLIINPFVGYFIDATERWQVYVAATNAADLRFGGEVYRDSAPYQIERIGPRVFAGLRWTLSGGQ